MNWENIMKANGDLSKRVREMESEADGLLKILKSYEKKAMQEGKDLNTKGRRRRRDSHLLAPSDPSPLVVDPEDIMPADVFEATRLLNEVRFAIRTLKKRGHLSSIERKYGD